MHKIGIYLNEMLIEDFLCFSQHANVACTLSGHASWVLSVAFSPDNQHFVSSSSDQTVRVWELNSRQCVHTFNEHTDQVITYYFINVTWKVKKGRKE